MAVNRNIAHDPAVVGGMKSKEDMVIDGLGRAPPPRAVAATADAAARATAAVGATGKAGDVAAVAPQEPAASNLARIAAELAAEAPVDTAKVAALRLAIASGDYTPDPDRIAAAMIALETPPGP